MPLLLLTLVPVFVACEEVGTELDDIQDDDTPEQEPHPEVTDQLSERWGDQVESFVLRDLSMGEIAEGLEAGSVTLPVVDPDGEIREVTLASGSVQLRVPDLDQGVERSGPTTDPAVEEVPLPPEQNYVLGRCTEVEQVDSETPCGGGTLLDDDRTMLGAMVIHPDVGTAYIQPVDLVLDDPATSGLHVLYNEAATPTVVFSEDEQPPLQSPPAPGPDGAARELTHTRESTQIVLDGDVEFYDEDPSTVWRRQELNLLIPRLAYVAMEWNSVHRWELDLSIKGQEVWVSGGPSTTDGEELNETLGDPNYFLVHSVEDDELHFFHVGYGVPGLYGRAGGIPNSNSSAFGNGSEQNNAWAQTRPAFSWKHQWVVIAHEIGHVIGGRHGDGCTSCSSGSLNGFSLMPAGGAGGPEKRDFFFSDSNDGNIQGAVNSILP